MSSQQFDSPYFHLNIPNERMKVVSLRKFAKTKRNKMIAAIAIFQLLAWVLYLIQNITAYLQFNLSEASVAVSFLMKMGLAFVHVFSQVHFIWFTLSSVLGIVGLMNVKSWGWAMALITNSLYIFIILTAYYEKTFSDNPFEKISLTFLIIFLIFSSIYLWVKRFVFWK